MISSKKEAPLLGLQGSGGGLGFLAGGAGEVEATGGYVSQAVGDDSHLYKYHLWTNGMLAPLQNFTVGSERTLDVLVVGGGGGGGGYAAGGGGAGGVLYGQITATEDLTARTVTIGGGGTGGASWDNPGTDGGSSSIILNGVTCTSAGGGGVEVQKVMPFPELVLVLVVVVVQEVMLVQLLLLQFQLLVEH